MRASRTASAACAAAQACWDNLPIWYKLRDLAELLAAHGVAVVASTYTNAWAELAGLIDPAQPLESMARTYLHPILNRGTGYKLATMQRMIADYALDGVILHSDRSCKPYSIGQMDQRDRLIRASGVQRCRRGADHNDPRAYADGQPPRVWRRSSRCWETERAPRLENHRDTETQSDIVAWRLAALLRAADDRQAGVTLPGPPEAARLTQANSVSPRLCGKAVSCSDRHIAFDPRGAEVQSGHDHHTRPRPRRRLNHNEARGSGCLRGARMERARAG
jgi:hypothetical protein